MLAVNITPHAATFYTSEGPVIYLSDTPAYEEACSIYFDPDISDTVKEDRLADLHRRGSMSITVAARKLSNNVYISENTDITYKGQPIPPIINSRLRNLVKAGYDFKPLLAFLEKLMQNPSNRIVGRLYEFMEYGRIPITTDGCFLAYKAVRADYKDIFSGTFFNRVGDVCEVPRNSVDEDDQRTCSSGLHVCSWDYLPCFAHAEGHVMICKINPADVVAIPADYHNTKMRVCRYEVVDEYQDYYSKDPHNLLAAKPFFDYGNDDPDADYLAGEQDYDNTDPLENDAPRNYALRAWNIDHTIALDIDNLTKDAALRLFDAIHPNYQTTHVYDADGSIVKEG